MEPLKTRRTLWLLPSAYQDLFTRILSSQESKGTNLFQRFAVRPGRIVRIAIAVALCALPSFGQTPFIDSIEINQANRKAAH